MLKYTEIVRDVLAAGRAQDVRRLDDHRNTVMSAKQTLDYQMDRFMDQFGHKLDKERNDEYHHFYRVKCEEYSRVTRLLRVITAVSK